MVLPVLLFWVVNYFFSFNIAVGFLSGLGLLGLLIRKPTMDFIEGTYKKNKYAMVQGFKQTGE